MLEAAPEQVQELSVEEALDSFHGAADGMITAMRQSFFFPNEVSFFQSEKYLFSSLMCLCSGQDTIPDISTIEWEKQTKEAMGETDKEAIATYWDQLLQQSGAQDFLSSGPSDRQND